MTRVDVRWEDPDGSHRLTSAILEDRSASGIGMRIGRSIPVGSKVNIKHGNLELSGVVRRCSREEIGYIVGVRLSAGSPAAD